MFQLKCQHLWHNGNNHKTLCLYPVLGVCEGLCAYVCSSKQIACQATITHRWEHRGLMQSWLVVHIYYKTLMLTAPHTHTLTLNTTHSGAMHCITTARLALAPVHVHVHTQGRSTTFWALYTGGTDGPPKFPIPAPEGGEQINQHNHKRTDKIRDKHTHTQTYPHKLMHTHIDTHK